MNTHEFLKKQIDQQLQTEGFSPRISFQVADEALEYFCRTAHFKRGGLSLNACPSLESGPRSLPSSTARRNPPDPPHSMPLRHYGARTPYEYP